MRASSCERSRAVRAHGPAGHFGGHPVPGLYHLNTGGMLAKSRTIKDTLGVDFRACDNYKNGFDAARNIRRSHVSQNRYI